MDLFKCRKIFIWCEEVKLNGSLYLSNSKLWVIRHPHGVIDEDGHQLLYLIKIFGPVLLQTEKKRNMLRE